MKINIKPLSVNEAWRGRRFKTPIYERWENILLYTLPPQIRGLEPQKKACLYLYLEAGLSTKNSDIDNVAKPMIDVLQKKYGFNDRYIYQLHLKKVVVDKGKEYIGIEFFNDKELFMKYLVKNT